MDTQRIGLETWDLEARPATQAKVSEATKQALQARKAKREAVNAALRAQELANRKPFFAWLFGK